MGNNSIILQSFKNTILSITDIPDGQIEKISTISQIKNMSKREFFIREGEKPKSFAFVIKGLFRYYYLDKKGNEFTKGFFQENSFISSYSALIENRESFFTIQALEDSSVMVIDYQGWLELQNNNFCWNRFLLSVVEKAFCKKEAREREFLLFDAKERYKSFLKTYPGLEKRVKQHLIASYIGITPQGLSRILKKTSSVNPG
jgi:CRP-like cAMP-binding protein